MKSTFLFISAAVFTVGALGAQPTVDDQDQANRLRERIAFAIEQGELTIPALYEGELEDTGPQFLLTTEPPRQPFRVFGDLQSYRTNNVNLVPGNRASTDVLVLTAEVSYEGSTRDCGFWTVTPEVGFRAQNFTYGLFGDSNKVANGAPVKNNDFHALTPYLRARWSNGPWFATVGLRYNQLRSTRGDTGTFYREWVPNWNAGHRFQVRENASLIAQYEGTYRFTPSSDGGGAVSRRFNDRTDHALAFYYLQTLGNRTVVQPFYRFQYTEYTHGSRSRRDRLNSAGVVASYYLSENASLRAFVGYDHRRSSPSSIFNYEAVTLGGGISAYVRY